MRQPAPGCLQNSQSEGNRGLGQEKGMDLLHSSLLAQRNELELAFVASCKDYLGH